MKKTFITCLLAIPLLWSCTNKVDSGPIISEARSVTDFDRVELRGSHELRINPEYDFDLRVTAPDNLMRHIETYIVNGELIIREKNNKIDHGRILVEISQNYLDRIRLNGSGLILAEDTIHSNSLEVKVDGSGSADIIAKSALLDLNIDGSGKIEAWGEAAEVRSDIDGSGLISSRSIESSTAHAEIKGSGSIDIFAGQSLSARVNGSGVIRYWGSPETIDQNINGSGAILEIN